jgi:hypothetical protein
MMTENNHVMEKDGELKPDKVNDAIMRINPEQREKILQNFDQFKSYLHNRITLADNFGLNEEQMAIITEKVAGYLAEHEEPRNSEEKLLQELWRVGTKEEQHKLAHMLLRLAQSKD